MIGTGCFGFTHANTYFPLDLKLYEARGSCLCCSLLYACAWHIVGAQLVGVKLGTEVLGKFQVLGEFPILGWELTE